MNQPFELENLTAELQGQIEDTCEEFEASWQQGQTPSLEQTLADFTSPSRELLLNELILIERYYRLRESGKLVSEQELLQDHPELADELSRLFAKSHATRTRIGGDSDQGLADSSGFQLGPVSKLHFDVFPAQFGRYQILSRLGAGGMGSVYLARDTQLERKVALKLPQIDRHADAQFISRFYREAKAAANLNHPNLCSVYDVDEIESVHYITMEFIEGKSLAEELLAGRRYTQRETVLLIQQLANALNLAHQQGIVHRDLKPANIMIRQDGTPIITDFGLALMSQTEEMTQITQHGQIMGSPSYMSPEQVDGDLEKIGPPSDIYSLGVMLYELLSGQRPFQGSTASILSQIMTANPKPIRQIEKDIDPQLDQICRKMMAREKEKRYSSFQQVEQDLANWLEKHQAAEHWKQASLWKRLFYPGWKQLTAISLTALLLLGFTLFKPTATQGTLHVTLNDERASVLLDGKPLDLETGSWSGLQNSGPHELSLQIGAQRLPFGELTTLKTEESEQRVLASVNGIHIKNGRFELAPAAKKSAEIKLHWLPLTPLAKTNETASPSANQTIPPSQDPTEFLSFTTEREITEWLIQQGCIVRFNMAHDFKYDVKDINELPAEPFRLKYVSFRESPDARLTDLSRLSQLMTLEALSLKTAAVTGSALKGLRFNQAFERLRIIHTPLKVSDLQVIQGLEFIDTLELSGSQIDDHFEFLKQMPNLRALEITSISPAALQELSQSPLLHQTKLRFLRLRSVGQFDDKVISQLQTARPGMTITSDGSGNKETYLGLPVAKRAADALIKQGCILKGEEPGRGKQNYTHDNFPSEQIPFGLSEVILPPDLKLTPEIIDHLACLPRYFTFRARKIKNADLLAELPSLRLCSGVHLIDSDLTDPAFKKLVQQDPDGFFHVRGTRVSKELAEKLDREHPYLAFYSNTRRGLRWMEVLFEERKRAKKIQPEIPEQQNSPSTDEIQLAFERETAEWVLELGGKVNLKKPQGFDKMVARVDQLPEEPIRILEIAFDQSSEKIKLPSLAHLSRLRSLHSLNISNCGLQFGALKGLEFGDLTTHFHMARTPAKATHLSAEVKGLEHLDTFGISAAQVNDHFGFLDLMPRLRDLHLWNPRTSQLKDLADSSGFKQANLRFLNLYSDGQTFDSDAIRDLQLKKPGMSIIFNDNTGHRRYLGNPVAHEAAMKLLDRGCIFKLPSPGQFDREYSKTRPPSPSELIRFNRLELPPDLEITTEIVEEISQLPSFHGIKAKGAKNADLLMAIPVLALCSGLQLDDSDLTDQGLETYFQNHPDGFLNARGSRVTKEGGEQVHLKYPLAAFYTSKAQAKRWLEELAKQKPRSPASSQRK